MDLYATQNELDATCRKLKETNKISEKEDMLCALGNQTNALLKTADEAVNDVQSLHDRLTKSRRILEHNYNMAEKFKMSFSWNLGDMKNRTNDFLTKGINDIESQIMADKKFLCFIMENQKALEELTNEIVKETGDRYQSILDLLTNQVNTSDNFLTAQSSILNSVVDANNQNVHEIISSLKEHTLKVKSDWKIFSNAFETNIKVLEHQRNNIEVILDTMTNLTKLTLAIPLKYSEKFREKEMALKLYKKKCDFLEKEQLSVRKQIHDFGPALLQMAQNYVEQLEREKECEEALKKLQAEKIFEDKTFLEDLVESVNQNLTDVNRQTEEVERIQQKIAASASEEIDNLKDVIPSISSAEDPEEKFYNFIKGLVQKNSSDLEASITRLKKVNEEANKKLVQFSESVEKKSNEIMKSMTVYSSEMDKTHEVQSSMIETTVQDNLVKKQMFSSNMADHLKESFSSIEDRMKEIETFFAEDMIKYEATGNTSQRKEFRYPKRIVESSFKNSDNISSGTDESKENISRGPSDTDCTVK